MPGIGYHTDQEDMVLAPHPRDTETQEHWLTKSSEFLEASLLATHPRDTETQEHWLTKSSEFLEASL